MTASIYDYSNVMCSTLAYAVFQCGEGLHRKLLKKGPLPVGTSYELKSGVNYFTFLAGN